MFVFGKIRTDRNIPGNQKMNIPNIHIHKESKLNETNPSEGPTKIANRTIIP
ncbi:hypothetical protein PbJCM13498_26240 [Prolixibacter bellariivorans]|uniref:Uncharacterized protein n=1 Tax=Prolixibacter bellariivorans TaxID=314319 RepID=A0A5M4B1H5_9BACT|nr:hypothetical protein PbJCM13498_26240 [Prolixibacter bellariivorans]